MGERIKVLVVDDSAVIRRTLSRRLSMHPRIEVVGTAPDPYVARDLILEHAPDVMTLDIEMPRMDGITFLHKLMRHHPMPVVVLSSLTRKGGDLAMEALEAGALAVLCKPRASFSASGAMEELAETILAAAGTDMGKMKALRAVPAPERRPLARTTNQVLAIGASTGGTAALETLLKGMPRNLPGTVVSQHLPELFTASFAKRLASETGLDVREARNGDSVIPGRVLIAPGNRHLLLERSGARYQVSVQDGPRVNRFRPSVDVMFHSVAAAAGKNAVGVILTGMGKDGAKGMLAMKKAGAFNIAQDEKSCVVFGMPKVAIELGGVDQVLPLAEIAPYLVEWFEKQGN